MKRDQRKTLRKILLGLAFAATGTFVLAQGSDWRAPASAANRPNPVPANANTIALGQKLYTANCFTCHGAEGNGDGPGAATLEKKPANGTASCFGKFPKGTPLCLVGKLLLFRKRSDGSL